MSAALHPSDPREFLRRAVVWFVGFAATGYVFHDVTAAQLRDLSPREVVQVVGSLAVVLFGVGYFVYVVPDDYALGFAAVIGYMLALRLSMWGLQWAGVKIMEARQ